MEYLNNIQYTKKKHRILKVKDSLLEFGKDFRELRDKKLRERKIKIRKDIEGLFFESINASIEDLDKFEENEVTKKKLFPKSTWYDWLINYIPDSPLPPHSHPNKWWNGGWC